MAKIDDTILSDLSLDELNERISEEASLLKRLRFNHEVTPLENPRVLGQSRKKIARMKTELRLREINQAKS